MAGVTQHPRGVAPLHGAELDRVGDTVGLVRTQGEGDDVFYARLMAKLENARGTRASVEAAVQACIEHSDFFVLEGGEQGFPGQLLVIVARHMDGPTYDGLVSTLEETLPAWVTFKVRAVDDPQHAAALRTTFALGGVDAARKLVVE